MRCSQTTAGSGSDALGRRMKLVGLERYNNMDESIIQAISTVGFPIVVAAAMFWKMNKQDDDHKQEMAKVTEAINNNTIALQKLIDKIG